MRKLLLVGLALVMAAAVGLTGYLAYAAYEGSRQLVTSEGRDTDCRTPDVQYSWAYEAINYDIADDALLRAYNADLRHCTYEGVKGGDAVVTDDGIRLAGWYIPAGNGAGPTAPTVVLVHGFKASKAGILHYALGLHEGFNLVAFDMRNVGRSTGDQTTGGVLEQKDLRAIIDWVEAIKHPTHLGVLGNSLGAATALAEARDDPRVEALALDSMHTRISYQLDARVAQAGYWSFFGTTWAIEFGVWARTGADITSIDAADTIRSYGVRPLLLTHGDGDTQDLPARTQAFFDGATALGIPAEVCATQFAEWTREFFARALGASGL